MQTFKWTRSFDTGVDVIDQQHRTLVDLLNALGELVAAGDEATPSALDRIFHELAAYAVYHFRSEEELMATADPAHVERHTREHESFLEDVARLRGEVSLERPESMQPLLAFLTHWLVYHILGSDQDLARQLAAARAGQSPATVSSWRSAEGNVMTASLLDALDGLFHLVSDRNRSLSELNRTLEARVAERTKELEHANERLQHLALTDALTGLPNRRHAMSRLELEWETDAPLSVMLIDADHFKEINDRHGHDAGDVVLKTLALTMRDAVRSDDVVCRLGGDEMLVICPKTPLAGALQLAESIRRAVAALRVPAGDGEWKGSISVGVAIRDEHITTPEALIKRADEGVYLAKARGRNAVATVFAAAAASDQPTSSAPTSTADPAGRASPS